MPCRKLQVLRHWFLVLNCGIGWWFESDSCVGVADYRTDKQAARNVRQYAHVYSQFNSRGHAEGVRVRLRYARQQRALNEVCAAGRRKIKYNEILIRITLTGLPTRLIDLLQICVTPNGFGEFKRRGDTYNHPRP